MKNMENISEIDEVEKSGKAVVIRAEAYKTIILYASRYGNKAIPAKDWKEIYGVLIGYSKDDLIFVERAEALTYGHATDVQLEAQDYVSIATIEDKLYEEGKGYYIIGWFHSHPGLGLFFSYIDLTNHIFFQGKNEDAIGLVFDHTLLGKRKEEVISGNKLTKFETGFEIYRMNDVNLGVDAPGFDSNYHKVDYIIEGLNKFFFANVLAELSTLVTEGKPLESAYGENYELESNYTNINEIQSSDNDVINQEVLSEIPNAQDMVFDVDDFFYDDAISKKERKKAQLKEEAEQLIFEGNHAFKEKDSFTGVEKFSQGIKLYKKIDDYERVLELLNQICEKCLLNDHLKLADQFVKELSNLSNDRNQLFYRGKAYYLRGYLLLKKDDENDLMIALKTIQKGAVDYVKENDFAGAGMCFHKIGSIYQFKLDDIESACLFFKEAIENYNNALISQHPLRKSLWSRAESLIPKIIDLRNLVDNLIPKLENQDLKDKIIDDLRNIKFNF